MCGEELIKKPGVTDGESIAELVHLILQLYGAIVASDKELGKKKEGSKNEKSE